MSTVDSSLSSNRCPGLHVDEVVEKALVAGHALGGVALRRVAQEAQRGENALARLLARDVAALDPDGIRGQPKSDGGDARIGRRRKAVGDQAVLRIRGVPEKAERALLQVDEDGVDHRTRPWRGAVLADEPIEIAGEARREEEEQHRADSDQRNGKAGAGAQHRYLQTGRHAETVPQPRAHEAAAWLAPLGPLVQTRRRKAKAGAANGQCEPVPPYGRSRRQVRLQ